MEKAKEMLVNSFFEPKIYLVKAKELKDGVVECIGNKKVDMTQNAINCVWHYLEKMIEKSDRDNICLESEESKYKLWLLPKDKFEKLNKGGKE